jgi:hypothetical protein
VQCSILVEEVVETPAGCRFADPGVPDKALYLASGYRVGEFGHSELAVSQARASTAGF